MAVRLNVGAPCYDALLLLLLLLLLMDQQPGATGHIVQKNKPKSSWEIDDGIRFQYTVKAFPMVFPLHVPRECYFAVYSSSSSSSSIACPYT